MLELINKIHVVYVELAAQTVGAIHKLQLSIFMHT